MHLSHKRRRKKLQRFKQRISYSKKRKYFFNPKGRNNGGNNGGNNGNTQNRRGSGVNGRLQ